MVGVGVSLKLESRVMIKVRLGASATARQDIVLVDR